MSEGGDDAGEVARPARGRGPREVVAAARVEPSPATKREWRDLRRRRRLGVTLRLCAPLAVVTILEVVLPRAHRDLAHRATASVRPVVLIVVVAIPLGWAALRLAAAYQRRRDRRRPSPPGVRYTGWAARETGSPRRFAFPQRAGGEIQLVDDRDGGEQGLRWEPRESARARGFQSLWISAGTVQSAEIDLSRRRRGEVRICFAAGGCVDFGIMDMARFSQAAQRSWLVDTDPGAPE